MYGYFVYPTMSGTVNNRQTLIVQSNPKLTPFILCFHITCLILCTCLTLDNVTNVKQVKISVHDVHNSNKSYAKDDGTIPMLQLY